MINQDVLRRYTYNNGFAKSIVTRLIDSFGVNKDTHPRVLDLAAGDGSVAAILSEMGWDERQIVCIDKYESPTPLVKSVKWLYEDLELVASVLSDDKEPSKQLQRIHQGFDIVAIMQSPLKQWEEEALVRYFAANTHTFVLSNWFTGFPSKKRG